MSLTVQCPACQTRIKVPSKLLGELVSCPRCRTSLQTPSPLPDKVRLQTDQAASLDFEAQQPRRRRELPDSPGRLDVFGTIGVLFGIFSLISKLFGCAGWFCCPPVGIGGGIATLLFGGIGLLSSFFGRGTIRIAGVILNALALLVGRQV
jgi:hypothetical protein